MSGVSDVKTAIWTRIRSDPTLMGATRLAGRGPFYGRLPKDSPHSRTVAAITLSADTTVTGGGQKESQTVTLDVWAFSHDLVEATATDLDRLFHPASGRAWIPLSVAAGRAFIRRESAIDVPDPASELWHKSLRFRILFAQAVAV